MISVTAGGVSPQNNNTCLQSPPLQIMCMHWMSGENWGTGPGKVIRIVCRRASENFQAKLSGSLTHPPQLQLLLLFTVPVQMCRIDHLVMPDDQDGESDRPNGQTSNIS
ncbi:hypothetical protein ACFX2I_019726 [Malus domestica]